MSAVPGPCCADWEGGDPVVRAHLAKHGVFEEAERMMAEDLADHIAQMTTIVMPLLWDAWLKAKPPCTSCDGMGFFLTASTRAIVVDGAVYPDSARIGCPDCPDGIQAFDKWTAALVALWTAVRDEYPPPVFRPAPNGVKEAWIAGAQAAYRHLRQIGGAQ